MNRRFGKFTLGFAGVVGLLGLVPEANAQAWTQAYTSPTATGDCAGLPATIESDSSSAAKFAIVPLINRTIFTNPQPARITKLAFALNKTTGKADIFVGERGSSAASPNSPARVSFYNAHATPPTLTVIGSFDGKAYTGFAESGVFGLAVNPMTFDQDNLLYVMYAVGNSRYEKNANIGWRVSRFRVHPTTRMMDMASEKVLLHIPASTAERWHTGTSLRFDNFGNLYIGAADNEATAMGPANTADLRGGILRIKPDTTNPRGYTIPEGNFGKYWASQWQAKGLAARASAYLDTTVVKPEIYVKGSRNPYSFGVDPYRLGWLAWSECGPDQQRGEEHNFTTKPAFSGWPFWAAMGVRQTAYASSYDEAGPTGADTLEPKSSTLWAAFNPATNDTAMPVNNWRLNTGHDTLPPMHRPYATQTNGCAMGGPIIRYNGKVNNPEKLPPHLDNVILSSNNTTWYAAKIDTATATPSAAQTVFTMPKSTSTTTFSRSSETVQGPDGVLYAVDQSETCCGTRALNNIEGVVKVVYKGTCKDTALAPKVTAIVPSKDLPHARSAEWLRVGGASFSITAPGLHEATVLDMAGRTVHTFRGEGHKTYVLPAMGSGLHVLRVKTSVGIVSSPLAAGL